MRKIPTNAVAYKKTKVFNEDCVPEALLNAHSTKDHVWGKICVLSGRLLYSIEDSKEEYILTPENHGIVEPTIKHKVKPLGKVEFYVEFYK